MAGGHELHLKQLMDGALEQVSTGRGKVIEVYFLLLYRVSIVHVHWTPAPAQLARLHMIPVLYIQRSSNIPQCRLAHPTTNCIMLVHRLTAAVELLTANRACPSS